MPISEFSPLTTHRVIALWSAPRSRSTAFLRMMLERRDHTVLHEPFSHVTDFGRAEIGGAVVTDQPAAIAAIRSLSRSGPVFFKDTTDFRYTGLLADDSFLRAVTHTFLIRDPAQIIASHFALTPDLKCADVGVERLWEIYEAVIAAGGRRPVVVDGDDLADRPEQTVKAYCAAVGLPFLSSALHWEPGMLPQWQRTSRWHEATSRTSGFAATSASYRQTVANNSLLAGYRDHHQPYYARLHALRLDVGP